MSSDRRAAGWMTRLTNLIKANESRRNDSAKKHVPRDEKILTQIEFYFSDANLRRDKYMHAAFSADPHGWMSARDLIRFPILKRMRVTENEVLFLARRSEFFIIDDDTRRLRRDFDRYPNREIEEQLRTKSASPPDAPSVVDKRSAYIEGLPVKFDHEDLTSELATQFPGLHVKYISIPRHPLTGETFGCAFVELGSEENANVVAKKLKRVETEIFNPVTGKLGRPVRVLTVPKYKALKRMYKAARSLSAVNRLGYCPEFDDGACMQDSETPPSPPLADGPGSVSTSESSSVLLDSEVNSLAQDSIDVRRARNASSIRSNSVIFISRLPSTSSANIRVWLSHSAAVQFLDHQEGNESAYARFASRREKDFFLRDFERSRLPLLGTLPQVRSLTEEECIEYFEAERERRRGQLVSLGHPDSWEQPPLKRQKTNETSHGPRVSSKLGIVGSRPTEARPPVAFTDTIAGNSNKREAGESLLFGIREGRHIARQFLKDGVRGDCLDEPESKKQRIDSPNSEKKTTRRGCRGGRRIVRH